MVARLCLWFLLLSTAPLALAAQFTASVDRSQLSMEEHIIFTLSLLNSDTRLRAEGVDPNVDLSLLTRNFTLGKPAASNKFNIYQGRGRSTSEIKVELFPKHSGRLTIPAFEIDGLKTAPITINVNPLPTDAAPEVFVRSGSNTNKPWAGQQLVVYLDVYHRVALNKASLGDTIETEPTDIDLLLYWKLPQASRKEMVNGYDYDVERIAWSLFSNEAGPMTVQLPDVWVTTEAGRQQRLPHQTVTIDIKPLPDGVPADIIIGKPELEQTLLPGQINQHNLTHWTVRLKAPVAVTALPEFLPGLVMPDELKFYPDPARRNTEQTVSGIIDQADYTLSLMPLEAGSFKLQPIRVPYFDPERGVADLVEIEGQTIIVAPAAVPTPASAIIDGNFTAAIGQSTSVTDTHNTLWQITTALFAALWLGTLYWLRRDYKTNDTPPEVKNARKAAEQQIRHPLQKQLLDAMGSRTLEQGLADWLAQQPDDTVVLAAVRAVQRVCYGTNRVADEAVQAQVKRAIQKLGGKITPASNKTASWKDEVFKTG